MDKVSTEPIIPAYIGIVDSDAWRQLKQLAARAKYYWESHKMRWSRRYKQPYPESEGELGVFEDIRWINGQ